MGIGEVIVICLTALMGLMTVIQGMLRAGGHRQIGQKA